MYLQRLLEIPHFNWIRYRVSFEDTQSDNMTCLNLNEFNVTEFLEFVYPHYFQKNELGLNVLQLSFFGNCDFRFLAQGSSMLVALKTKDPAMVNLLQTHPKLIVDSKYLFCLQINKSGENILEIEDFKIIQELWILHKGFRRIDIPGRNVSLERLVPMRLLTMCQRLLKDNGLNNLPEHVAKRLKKKIIH